MKRRTVVGSILSVFMLVVVTCIIPVNVKAYETEEEKILDELNGFSEQLSEDSDFKNLALMHESLALENIFKQVLNAENSNQIETLANQYVELVDIEKINQLTESLTGKYRLDFETLTFDITNFYQSHSENYDESIESFYYKISEDENGMRIIKQKSDKSSENDILIQGSDGAMKISNGEWITQDALDNLKEFFNILIGAGAIGMYAGIYLGLIGLALAEIGFENFGFLLFRFGMRFGVFSLFTAIYSSVFLMLIDVLEKQFDNEESTHKSKSYTFLNNLINIRNFENIFGKIFRHIQNINAKIN